MSMGTTEMQKQSNTRSIAWLAGATGTAIGIAALAYRRRRRSPWERARDRASHTIDMAREEIKPWMGVAAGTAAAGTALAVYMRNHRETGWQRTGRQASELASRIG